ncbi:MAG: type II and III secretion system protein family protein [Vicinamibacterales bacterium]
MRRLATGRLAPILVGLASATVPASAQEVPRSQTASAVQSAATERVVLTAGRSTVVSTPFDITRIAITDPKVADAVVVQPREVLIDGKGPGTVSLIVWGGAERAQYDVVVDPGVLTLQQQMQTLFPGEEIHVSLNDEAVILFGRVSSNVVSLRAAEVAQATSSKLRVLNMLQLPGTQESEQVLLQVRVAEVNRKAMTEAGLGLFLARNDSIARSTTQQYPAPDFDQDGSVGVLKFSDFLNLFFYNQTHGIGGVLKALEQKGFFQTLAEPNLIAYNGQEASFLAGGEFPIPVIQGATGAVTIVFKEFGVRLNFTPRIAGDTIRLKVRPEVSALDFNNGITLQGFRVPALTTRRAETDVELRDGQSFAIAGLLNNTAQNDSAAVPILSRLPIIGPLFRSKADRAEQTELMVIVTPRLVRPLDPDEVPALPTRPDLFLENDSSQGEGLQDAPPVEQPPAPKPPAPKRPGRETTPERKPQP